jgi:hypothetical protein
LVQNTALLLRAELEAQTYEPVDEHGRGREKATQRFSCFEMQGSRGQTSFAMRVCNPERERPSITRAPTHASGMRWFCTVLRDHSSKPCDSG